MREYRSIQSEMSVTGGCRAGGQDETDRTSSSKLDISALSTKSRSFTFLTTFCGRQVAGLNGPWASRRAESAAFCAGW